MCRAGRVDYRILQGVSQYDDIDKFFEDYTAVPVVGAIAFIAKYMVDKNRNGRPDAIEKELKKDDVKRN
ncbi:hypothetical protein [Dialister invisus]|uniref:hypothetical protein n=1 Tax=Dialister invisus TaxID=218538 RepID=UPI00265B066A|nr:hypothetical protein [Dialister invisus]